MVPVTLRARRRAVRPPAALGDWRQAAASRCQLARRRRHVKAAAAAASAARRVPVPQQRVGRVERPTRLRLHARHLGVGRALLPRVLARRQHLRQRARGGRGRRLARLRRLQRREVERERGRQRTPLEAGRRRRPRARAHFRLFVRLFGRLCRRFVRLFGRLGRRFVRLFGRLGRRFRLFERLFGRLCRRFRLCVRLGRLCRLARLAARLGAPRLLRARRRARAVQSRKDVEERRPNRRLVARNGSARNARQVERRRLVAVGRIGGCGARPQRVARRLAAVALQRSVQCVHPLAAARPLAQLAQLSRARSNRCAI